MSAVANPLAGVDTEQMTTASAGQNEGSQPAPENPEAGLDNGNAVLPENVNVPVDNGGASPDKSAQNAKTTEEEKPSTTQVEEGKSDWSQRFSTEGFTKSLAYEWLTDVTTRVTTLEKHGDENKKENDSKTENNYSTPSSLSLKPQVRDCNWEQFKNRYSAEECSFAIETLLASDDLEIQMGDEQLRRLPVESRKHIIEETNDKPAQGIKVDKNTLIPRLERIRINSPALMRFLRKTVGDSSWSTRPHTFLRPFKSLIHFHDELEKEFRILQNNFEAPAYAEVVLTKSTQSPMETADKPLVESALSPKQEDSMQPDPSDGQESPNNAKQHTPQEENATNPTSHKSDVAATEKIPGTTEQHSSAKQEQDDSPEQEVFSREEFEIIKCYMEFARTRLLHTYHKFEHLDHSHQAKICYDDLWSLFRLGELVVERDDSKVDSSRPDANSRGSVPGRSGGPRLFRVSFVSSETLEWKLDNLEDQEGEIIRRYKASEPEPINVQAYYIDFDGTSYAGVDRTWTFPRFKGEKEITKLRLYPVRFHKDSGKLIREFQERGERFRDLLEQKHLSIEHDGWTLTQSPVGELVVNEWGDTQSAEFINSDVIIDFQEAFQTQSAWKPEFSSFTKNTTEPLTEYDDFVVIQWSGPDRANTVNKFKEVVVEYDRVGGLEWNKMSETDNFIVDLAERTTEADGAKQILTPEDLCLLPSRLLVYSLRNRKFVHADIENLKQPPVMSNPFDELKISDARKRLIKSIVQDHFDKKNIQRELETEGLEPMEQDFIRGKGKGLVILLHGAPGVGKTATAEAVAYAHRRPLFPITCGDLGIDPVAVETSLSSIFRLANLWDCVLLLDEAEIFLSHREKKDDNLQRNALVSIFLRTLEYYPGILFLTTNRVGVLDEALTSRVHVSIFFPYLDLQQTVALFNMNLKRSEMIADQRAARTKEPKISIRHEEIREFAMEHFSSRPSQSSPWWNGRQIRNAFQIATSLAYADHPNDGDISKRYLGREHFEQVLGFIRDYDQYRQSLFQKTDHELAEHREERTQGPSNVYGRQDTRGYNLTPDPYRPRAFTPQHMPAFSSAATPERQDAADFMGPESRAFAPTPQRRERAHSPMYSGFSGGGVEQRPSQGGWDARDFDHYGNPLQRMR